MLEQTQHKYSKLLNNPILKVLMLIILLTLITNVLALFLNKEDTDSLGYKILIQPMINYLAFMQSTLHIQPAFAVIILTITVKLLLSPISLYGRLHPSLLLKLGIATIQLPFLNALYFLTTKQETFANQQLFGLDLDKKSLTLALFVTVIYFANNVLLYDFYQKHIYYDRNYQQRILATITPLMILLFTNNVVSGIALYLLISCIFSFIETLFMFKKTSRNVNSHHL